MTLTRRLANHQHPAATAYTKTLAFVRAALNDAEQAYATNPTATNAAQVVGLRADWALVTTYAATWLTTAELAA